MIEKNLGGNSDYIAVFIPGGHGALIGLPESLDVKTVLKWAADKDKHIISLCHGPAAFLAAAVGEKDGDYLLKGYKMCAFPDAIDRKTPEMGYMPGGLTWFFGEKLKKLGVDIVNDDITGKVHQDRKLITGDSPFAANNLGKASARALLEEVGKA